MYLPWTPLLLAEASLLETKRECVLEGVPWFHAYSRSSSFGHFPSRYCYLNSFWNHLEDEAECEM